MIRSHMRTFRTGTSRQTVWRRTAEGAGKRRPSPDGRGAVRPPGPGRCADAASAVRRAAAGLAVLGAAAGTADAAEYCVACFGPGAVYRCEAQGFGAAQDSRAQLACITELARIEKHRSCSVARGTAETCEGPVRVVRRELLPGAAGSADVTAAAPPAPAAADGEERVPPEPKASLAARTAEKTGQAVGDTARAAEQQITKAGTAIGSAAKKAWHCLASLMSDC